MKKILLVLTASLLSFFHSYGQITEAPINMRIDSSADIFEGTVLRTTSFWNEDSTNIYTSNIIQITKIFQGSLACGTVQIITRGGRVGINVEIISENLELGEGQTGIFFCNATSMPSLTVSVTNATALEVYSSLQGFIQYDINGSDTTAHDPFTQYNALRLTYNYISARTGYHYTTCPGSGPEPTHNHNYQAGFARYMQLLNKKAQMMQANKSEHKTEASSQQITYTFGNVQVTGTIPAYLEFDIDVQGSSDKTYLNNALMHIQYNHNAFGTNIVTNNKVTATLGSKFSYSDYDSVHLGDISDSDFTIGVGELYKATNLFNLTQNVDQLCHVKIEITACSGQSARLSFVDTSSTSGFGWYGNFASDTTISYYNPVIQVDKNNLAFTCPSTGPAISGLSPTIPIIAGANKTLTINGTDFGTRGRKSTVFFKNANTDTGRAQVDACDIISWSPTQIKIIVPSLTDSVSGFACAGTGDITVRDSNGNMSPFTSNDYLTVKYSIIDDRSNKNGYKYREHLLNTNGSGGYTFTFNSSFYSDTLARKIFQKSMQDWMCATHVNFKTSATTTSINTSARDGVNVVTFGKVKNANALAETTTWGQVCPSDTTKLYIKEIDVVYSNDPSITWYYDSSYTNIPPSADYDFFSVVEHEMGHDCLLNHVANPTELMYYAIGAGKKRAGITTYADSGGVNVVDTSVLITYGCGATHMIAVTGLTCTTHHTLGFEDLELPPNEISIYPNPTNGGLTASFFMDKPSPYSIALYDISGRQIYYMQSDNNIGGQQQIPIDALKNNNPGIYLMRVTIGTEMYSQKIIRQ